MKNIFLIFFSFSLFLSCGDNTSTIENTATKCKYGEPNAIFLPTNQAIEATKFKLENKVGIETVQFKNRVHLELTQSGCNEIKQDFTFTLPMTKEDAEPQFWILQAAQLMRFLGKSDLSLVQFNEWAKIIEQSVPQLLLGQELEVQSGFFVTIDKIDGGDESIIKVVFEGK